MDAERDRLLMLPDAELSKLCDLDFFKATGPGGQKRNKSSSAVRLTLRGSDLSVTDCTERSQHQNRARALRKLRMLLALRFRREFAGLIRVNCAAAHMDYPLYVAQMLDALAECDWEIAPAAVKLGMSTTMLWKKLSRDRELWQFFAAARREIGAPPLKPAE